MSGLITIALICGAAYIIVSPLRHHLHMLQQHSYRIDRYWDWFKPRWFKEYRRGEALLIIPLILVFFNTTAFAIGEIAIFALLLLVYWPRPAKDKKPLVLTQRAVRLYAVAALLAVLDTLVFVLLPNPLLIGVGFIVMCALSWVYMIAGAWILTPVEKKINNRYLAEAAAKIEALPDLTRIGITGSFGKTSTKLIMAAVLGEKYQTLATPGSFNTPMGVTKVIRESLSPIDEVFICEMGARQKGDIAELCRIVHPGIGVLTAIGAQHLESFGTIERIVDTKFELVESLPQDGLAVVNGDDPRIAANIGRSPCPVIRYGIDPKNDYWADQISYGAGGASFVFHHGENKAVFSTALLGRHMVINILAALAVGDQLGLSVSQMQRAVKALQPIEHRLQLRRAGDYLIIDDAFNANPAGAAAALEVLAGFTGGKKIVITPGMVELGDMQYQLNFEFGRQMAGVCDNVILVGKRHSRPLRDGLNAAAYAKEKLYVAADLADARAYLSRILGKGDVVLFENDLPDTYNE